MITYETNTSSFFAANKQYCEEIQQNLSAMQPTISGFCNSFGYDVEAHFEDKGKEKCTFLFHKHQAARNGGIVAINAFNYESTELIIKGLSDMRTITYEDAPIKRFFMSKTLKNKIPSPYFLSFPTTDDSMINAFIAAILVEQITTFKLASGTLTCKTHTAVADPTDFLAKIKAILSI